VHPSSPISPWIRGRTELEQAGIIPASVIVAQFGSTIPHLELTNYPATS
jgi:hypothetical protein